MRNRGGVKTVGVEKRGEKRERGIGRLCANPGYGLVCKLFLIGQSDGSSVKEVSLGKLLLALYHLCVRAHSYERVCFLLGS